MGSYLGCGLEQPRQSCFHFFVLINGGWLASVNGVFPVWVWLQCCKTFHCVVVTVAVAVVLWGVRDPAVLAIQRRRCLVFVLSILGEVLQCSLISLGCCWTRTVPKSWLFLVRHSILEQCRDLLRWSDFCWCDLWRVIQIACGGVAWSWFSIDGVLLRRWWPTEPASFRVDSELDPCC